MEQKEKIKKNNELKENENVDASIKKKFCVALFSIEIKIKK